MVVDKELTETEVLKHYRQLPDEEKFKDLELMNSMLKLIKKFDGIKIYNMCNKEKNSIEES